tara:strand:- start:265 stop:954 length:690 start_codon:yes stop_codon:yes gene_type:complete
MSGIIGNIGTKSGIINNSAKVTSAGHFKASSGDNAGSDTWSGDGNGHVFHINTGDQTMSVENSHDSTPYGMLIDFSDASPDDTSYWFFLARDGSDSAKCVIYANGNLVNSNNSYGTFSDERLKTNISEASSQWEDIKALKFKKFKLKEHGEDASFLLGLIAQDVEKTSPYLVEEYPVSEYHINTLGFEKDETVKGIKSSIVFMKGMRALQEAMSRIETLEAKVAALEGA